jgi:hypothetical protein
VNFWFFGIHNDLRIALCARNISVASLGVAVLVDPTPRFRTPLWQRSRLESARRGAAATNEGAAFGTTAQVQQGSSISDTILTKVTGGYGSANPNTTLENHIQRAIVWVITGAKASEHLFSSNSDFDSCE